MDTSDDPIIDYFTLKPYRDVLMPEVEDPFLQAKPEETDATAEAMLSKEDEKKKQRYAAAVMSQDWSEPMLSRPGLLGM